MVALGRALRAAGVNAGPDRVAEAVRAVERARPRSTGDDRLLGRPAHALLRPGRPGPVRRRLRRPASAATCPGCGRARRWSAAACRSRWPGRTPPRATARTASEAVALRAAASTVEMLRHQDVTALTARRAGGAAPAAGRARRCPARPAASRRWRPAPPPARSTRAGPSATLLHAGGEPVRLRRRRHDACGRAGWCCSSTSAAR